MTKIGTFKRGDTLAFYIALSDTDGAITGIASDMVCQIRSKPNIRGDLLAEPTITEHDTVPGTYLLEYTGSTRAWPASVFLDIQYTYEGRVDSTDTFKINLTEDVTDDNG